MNPLKVNSLLKSCEVTEKEKDGYKNFLKYFPNGFSSALKKEICNAFAKCDLSFFICCDRSNKQKSHCTSCNHYVVLPEKSRHNDKYICPYCGIKGMIKHTWRLHHPLRNTMYMQYYEKADYDKKSLVCRGLYIIRFISLESYQVSYDIEVKAFYLFQYHNCKMVRYHGPSCYYGAYLSDSKSIHTLWSKFFHADVLNDNIESFKKAVIGTKWEHCCYEDILPYLDLDLIRLLEFYDRYPQMEYIVKAGFASIIAKKVKQQPVCIDGQLLNLKATDVRKSLKLPGLTKKDKNYIRSFNGNVKPEQLKFWQILKSENLNNDLNVDYLKGNYGQKIFESSWMLLAIIDIHKILPSIKKIVTYVYKQFNSYENHDRLTVYSIMRDWRDYLDECKFLNLNLHDAAILFPKNLQVAHENTSKQLKIKHDELANEKIKRLSVERQQYKYSFKNLLSMPAESVDDLIAEGAALNHCVGTYADRYAKGETDIVFIRKVSEPDRSFYTMEIKNNQVAQVRGSHNCGMTDEVKEFVEHFKNDVLNKPQKISKKKGSKAA